MCENFTNCPKALKSYGCQVTQKHIKSKTKCLHELVDVYPWFVNESFASLHMIDIN